MKKIGIVAGTKYDTSLGVNLMLLGKFESKGICISDTASDQHKLQLNDTKKLQELVRLAILDLKLNFGAEAVVIYCTSISGIVDVPQLMEETQINIITPYDVILKNISQLKNIAVLSANELSLTNFKKNILFHHSEINIFGFCNIEMVIDIENELPPIDIIKKYSLDVFFNSLKSQNIELLILGCTHFSYLHGAISELCAIELLDPKDHMIELINRMN